MSVIVVSRRGLRHAAAAQPGSDRDFDGKLVGRLRHACPDGAFRMGNSSALRHSVVEIVWLVGRDRCPNWLELRPVVTLLESVLAAAEASDRQKHNLDIKP
jgi:hypothetical protein